MLTDQAQSFEAAKLWLNISFYVYFFEGSSIILLTLSKIPCSMSVPSNVNTLYKNFSGFCIKFWDFFQTLSSGSAAETFYFNNASTTRHVITTPAGGFAKAFISPTCFFWRHLTASSACFKAGSASAKATAHSAASFSAASFWVFVLASSSFALACYSSAMLDSVETYSIKTSVYSLCFLTSTILIFNYSWSPSTLLLVSARIWRPKVYLLICLSIWPFLSSRRVL